MQIHELQDLGDKLRMIVMAHRRIRAVEALPEDADSGLETSPPVSDNGRTVGLIEMGSWVLAEA